MKLKRGNQRRMNRNGRHTKAAMCFLSGLNESLLANARLARRVIQPSAPPVVTETLRIGVYTVHFSARIECATVTVDGLLLPTVVHEENGPHAFDLCEKWCYEQPGAPRQINHYGVEQLTKAEAVALYDAGADQWKDKTPDEIASFQLFQDRLCMPWDLFQESMETVLGRPVMTHEFGSRNLEALIKEYWGEKPAPTFQEVLDLIPEAKRIVILPAENFTSWNDPSDIPLSSEDDNLPR